MKKENFITLVVSLLFLTSCQKGPILTITSSAPAIIEKNGTRICESTPTTICRTGGYFHQDPLMSDVCIGGADTRLEAFPLDPNNGFKQSKIVSASCDQTISVFFDMSSGGMVNIVEHDTKTDLISERLILLKNLRKKDLISEEEYRRKKEEVLRNFK